MPKETHPLADTSFYIWLILHRPGDRSALEPDLKDRIHLIVLAEVEKDAQRPWEEIVDLLLAPYADTCPN